MRPQALLVVLAALLVLAFTGVAAALHLQVGSTVLNFDARVTPKTLTKTTTQPAAIRVSGRVSTTDGSTPAALTKILVRSDQDVSLETEGLPACKLTRIQSTNSREAAKACRRSLLGRGTMATTVAFPGAAPISVQGRLLIFNGARKHRPPLLLAHMYAQSPSPTAIVTPVRIRRVSRNGLSAIAAVPRIAGGAGFLTSFDVKISKKYSFRGERRSVISASCGHRQIRFEVTAFFANGGSSRGSLAHGCKAR
ncbi:MAG TPA: hypothetical protein VFX45_00275 [Solirubrobacterales bacterium]|nr:hypothetical protein [Solirubrobacterales bacterium]